MTDPDTVVRRWNPRGWARLHEPPASTVRVVGIEGSGRRTLVAELTALDPNGPEYLLDGDAAVVLLVLDASASLGRTELTALDAATAGAVTIICALTGIDRYPHWKTIRDHTVETLHRHVTWAGPIAVLPVSARAAARARELGDDVGDILRIESGIVEVHRVIGAAVRTASEPRAVRAALLARTRAMITDETTAQRTGDDTAGLRAERARLLGGTDDHTTPHPDVRRLRVRLLQDVATRTRAASTRFQEALDDGTRPIEDVVHLLTGQLDTMRHEIARSVARLPAPAPPGDDPPPLGVGEPPGPRAHTLEDRLVVVLGVSAGAGLGRLVATTTGALPALWVAVLTVVAGFGAAWWLVRTRRRLAHRERIRRWGLDRLTDARADLESWVRTRIFDVESHLDARHAVEQRARAERRGARLADLDERIARRLGERRARLAACERDLSILDGTDRAARASHPVETR